jgi:gamma-glutamyltranspeptidase/glutathione hydrolase
MSDFSAKEGALTSQGLAYGNANCIEGGKTPLSSMCPTIVFKDGNPFLAIGAAGGPRIITGTLQGILNAVDFGMMPEELVRMPFITCLTKAQGLELESGISEDTKNLLKAKGHKIVTVSDGLVLSSMLNCVMYRDRQFYPCATERVDGCGGALMSNGHILLDGICQEDFEK